MVTEAFNSLIFHAATNHLHAGDMRFISRTVALALALSMLAYPGSAVADAGDEAFAAAAALMRSSAGRRRARCFRSC